MIINGLLGSVLIGLLTVILLSWLNAGAKVLKPYVISFGDDIAIRCLHDGSIQATVKAYEKADWAFFKAERSISPESYTEEEYKAIQAEYDSVGTFAAMQEAHDYVDVSAGSYGSLAAVHADGSIAFNKRAEQRYHTSAQDAEWQNVKELDIGAYSVLALKKDGTAAAKPWMPSYAFTAGISPETWQNIKTISNDIYAVGLKEDGTVCWAAITTEPWDPDNFIHPDEMFSWTNIVQTDTSWGTVAGLTADGTVVLAGDTGNGKSAALHWKNIQKVAVGMAFVVGLKKDGTLVSTAQWALEGGETLKNVADVYANRHYVLAVLSNGRTRLLGKPEEKVYDGAWPAGRWVFPGE